MTIPLKKVIPICFIIFSLLSCRSKKVDYDGFYSKDLKILRKIKDSSIISYEGENGNNHIRIHFFEDSTFWLYYYHFPPYVSCGKWEEKSGTINIKSDKDIYYNILAKVNLIEPERTQHSSLFSYFDMNGEYTINDVYLIEETFDDSLEDNYSSEYTFLKEFEEFSIKDVIPLRKTWEVDGDTCKSLTKGVVLNIIKKKGLDEIHVKCIESIIVYKFELDKKLVKIGDFIDKYTPLGISKSDIAELEVFRNMGERNNYLLDIHKNNNSKK